MYKNPLQLVRSFSALSLTVSEAMMLIYVACEIFAKFYTATFLKLLQKQIPAWQHIIHPRCHSHLHTDQQFYLSAHETAWNLWLHYLPQNETN